MKESTGFQIVVLFFIVLSTLILFLWYISLRVPIFEQNGNLTNVSTIAIEIAIGIFIAISILITEKSWQGKITALITRSETILSEHEKDRSRRREFAISRLKSELGRMENWVEMANHYIEDYTKTKNNPESSKDDIDWTIDWLKTMDGVRIDNIRVLENIIEFSNDAFEPTDLCDIEELVEYGKKFYIPQQRNDVTIPEYFRDELTPMIREKLQQLQERIKESA